MSPHMLCFLWWYELCLYLISPRMLCLLWWYDLCVYSMSPHMHTQCVCAPSAAVSFAV